MRTLGSALSAGLKCGNLHLERHLGELADIHSNRLGCMPSALCLVRVGAVYRLLSTCFVNLRNWKCRNWKMAYHLQSGGVNLEFGQIAYDT